jgi:hypothetical protein
MIRSRFLQFVVFILLLVFIDQITGRIMRSMYFHQKAGQARNLNYVFSECRSPVLVFGNSRAQHHYDTRILSDSLGMDCFNAGQDGGHSILLAYAQISILLQRFAPRIIILEFDPVSVEYRKEDYEKLSILLPYYKEYPSIRPLIEKRDDFEKVKFLSASYPFNSDLVNIIRYNTNTYAARKKDINGYIPMGDRQIQAAQARTKSVNEQPNPVDQNKLDALKKIIEICNNEHVFLVVCNSPIYHPRDEDPDSVTYPAKLAIRLMKEQGACYLDFSYDPAFLGRNDLFSDNLHLNLTGATMYSGIIAGWLKDNSKLCMCNKRF